MDWKEWILSKKVQSVLFLPFLMKSQLPQSSDLSVTLPISPRNAQELQELLLCTGLLASLLYWEKVCTQLFIQTLYFRQFEL